MAVHHHDHNIVYAGLRNSRIHVEDLRVRGGRTSSAIAKLDRGKAVIGIKRLKDSAVPYGLVASGMNNEVSLSLLQVQSIGFQCDGVADVMNLVVIV